MRRGALAVVVVAVASADDAAAQILDRTSQPPVSVLSAARWTDHPIRPGMTPIKTAHFDELRARVAALRTREGLPPVRWADPVLTPGTTTVRRTHLAELRTALSGVYETRGRRQPAYMDRNLTAGRTGRTPVRAAHVMELREAVEILEDPTSSLESYYTMLPFDVIDPSYRPHQHHSYHTDMDGDGNEDLVLLGATWPDPPLGVTAENHRPQPGRVLLGDGDGGFRRASSELFPVDTLNTITPSWTSPFGDLNADGRLDWFIAEGGWDAPPFPGGQNRLYLSRPGGGWRDATGELPQLSDFSHSAAIGDIRGLETPDIVVGDIWRSVPPENQILPYALLNNGDETFSLDRSIVPVSPDETFHFHFVSRGFTITGTVLTDLDADGLPDLIALGDGYVGEGHDGFPGIDAVSSVFWNRAGAFSEQHKTPLPSPEVFAQGGHIDLDAAVLDPDGDGLLDLVIVGTRHDPCYDGWFVQLSMNQGDGTLVDETSLRLQPHEQSSGNAGVATGAPSARQVDVLDFNGDGAADFAMPACCRLPTESAAHLAERRKRAVLGAQGARLHPSRLLARVAVSAQGCAPCEDAARLQLHRYLVRLRMAATWRSRGHPDRAAGDPTIPLAQLAHLVVCPKNDLTVQHPRARRRCARFVPENREFSAFSTTAVRCKAISRTHH